MAWLRFKKEVTVRRGGGRNGGGKRKEMPGAAGLWKREVIRTEKRSKKK